MLDVIIGILIIAILGTFAICSCIVSSNCNKYEGYKRNNRNEENK